VSTSLDGARPAFLLFRVVQDGDRGAVRAFLDRLSPSTVEKRYLQRSLRLTGPAGDREVNRLVGRHEPRRVVVLALDGTDVRGIGEFFDESLGRADLGLVVEDGYQGRGIGRALLRRLEKLALNRGIRAFTGDMAYGNVGAAGLLRGAGRPLQTRVGSGGVQFTLVLQA
jgi:GNAT superfamily N-acetyltransferase